MTPTSKSVVYNLWVTAGDRVGLKMAMINVFMNNLFINVQ